LETVIPKEENGMVAVLKGEFKGETGKIIARDRKKDEVVI
jgi:ribosomal protein L24